MRKRHIKSVAHWVIMCFILLFPIVMVGISSFGNHETIHVVEQRPIYYETNDVASGNDILEGRYYHFQVDDIANDLDEFFVLQFTEYNNLYGSTPITASATSFGVVPYIRKSSTDNRIFFAISNVDINTDTVKIYLSYLEFDFLASTNDLTYLNVLVPFISRCDINYVKEYVQVEFTQNYYMREDVNQWCNTFRNLPVNQWYGDMLDTIGLGITTSMMMNVIYTYPLYVLWVYIIDLLVDCLLVIINFGHNALKRLGGENE